MQKSLSPKKGVSGCAGYRMASHLACKMCLEALVWGWVKVLEMLTVHIWVGVRIEDKLEEKDDLFPGGKDELNYTLSHNTGPIFVAWKMGISQIQSNKTLELLSLYFCLMNSELNFCTGSDPGEISYLWLILISSTFPLFLWFFGLYPLVLLWVAQGFDLAVSPGGQHNPLLRLGARHTEGRWGLQPVQTRGHFSSSPAAEAEGRRGNFRIYHLLWRGGKRRIRTGISTAGERTCGNLVAAYLFPILFTIPFIFFKESEQFKLTYPLI